MSNQSFDDMFDAPAFRAAKSQGSRVGPKMWPKSTSQMRGHTSFASQGISGISDGDGYLDHKMATASSKAAVMKPKMAANTINRPKTAAGIAPHSTPHAAPQPCTAVACGPKKKATSGAATAPFYHQGQPGVRSWESTSSA